MDKFINYSLNFLDQQKNLKKQETYLKATQVGTPLFIGSNMNQRISQHLDPVKDSSLSVVLVFSQMKRGK